MEETVISAVIPMTTPSTVRNERSLFSRSVSRAIFAFSPSAIRMNSRSFYSAGCPSKLRVNKHSPHSYSDFLPQRFDRTQVRGLACRIQSEENAHGGRNTQRRDYRRDRDVHRHRRV